MKFGEEWLPLEPETMSTLRRQFERMHMVIIDEMSLVAADMFYNIHKRLVEILYLKEMFADRAVMLVGDLLQIPPVRQQKNSKILAACFLIETLFDVLSKDLFYHTKNVSNSTLYPDVLKIKTNFCETKFFENAICLLFTNFQMHHLAGYPSHRVAR